MWLPRYEVSWLRLELLKEAVPKASRVMFLQDPETSPNALKLTQEVAPRLGVRLQVANVGAPEELQPELAMIGKEHPDALLVYPDIVFIIGHILGRSNSPTSP